MGSAPLYPASFASIFSYHGKHAASPASFVYILATKSIFSLRSYNGQRALSLAGFAQVFSRYHGQRDVSPASFVQGYSWFGFQLPTTQPKLNHEESAPSVGLSRSSCESEMMTLTNNFLSKQKIKRHYILRSKESPPDQWVYLFAQTNITHRKFFV